MKMNVDVAEMSRQYVLERMFPIKELKDFDLLTLILDKHQVSYHLPIGTAYNRCNIWMLCQDVSMGRYGYWKKGKHTQKVTYATL